MSLTDLLLVLMPNELLPLVIVGVGLALIVGVMNRRRALGLVLLVVSLPVLEQVFAALLNGMPAWLLLCLCMFIAIQILRVLLESVVGREAAGHILGALVIGVCRFAFHLMILPLRAVAGLAGAGIRAVAARALRP